NLIAKTIFSISNEESRYTLNGALLVLKPESITMVATDGHRLAHIEHVTSKLPVSGEMKVLIPKKAMGELSSLLGSSDVEVVEFLRVVGAGDVRFEFKDAQSAGQLRPDEATDSEYKYRYIIMPMRI